jgi:hypothetical protein
MMVKKKPGSYYYDHVSVTKGDGFEPAVLRMRP